MQQSRDLLYRRHRFPAEVISYAVWLYYRFPLSLRMVEEMLAARGIIVSHETFVVGPRSLVGNSPIAFVAVRRFVAINGISTRSLLRWAERNIGSGAPSIRMASFSTSSSKTGEIEAQRSGSCGSC